MVVHGYFRLKWGLCCHLSSTRGSYTSPHKCFLAIDHIVGFLVETISRSKSVRVSLWYYWKWSFMVFSTKMGVVWPFIIDQRLVHLTPHMFPCHRSHSWISGVDHFLVKNLYVLAFAIIENGHSWLFSKKCGLWGHWSSTRGLVNLTPHMFPCHRSHSLISGGDHFLVKNPNVLAFGTIENGRSWLFSTKMGVVWPVILDYRLIHLTTHMFPCHRSHSWIYGGDHFLVKNL
jgi:hypothetical protein